MHIEEIHEGFAFEKAVLGISSDKIDADVRNSKPNANRGYETKFHKAVGIVKDLQNKIGNWNPKKPPTEIARKLFEMVSDKLGDKMQENLRFFSSVGTLLDRKYSTDCFFAIKGEKRGYIVTIDLTTNRAKSGSKADIVLTAYDLNNSHRCNEIAEKIASLLKSQKR